MCKRENHIMRQPDGDAVAELIRAKGGYRAFAEAVGQQPGTVRNWKWRGSIPRAVWPDIIKAYRDVTLKRLMDLEAAQSEKGASR